jgi:hypothetical protein
MDLFFNSSANQGSYTRKEYFKTSQRKANKK